MKQFIKKDVDIWDIFLKHYQLDEEIVFLYTNQENEREHYSILAHAPYAKVSQKDGIVCIDGMVTKKDFSEAVDELRIKKAQNLKNWPIEPELLGFVSYEKDPACFALYDELILFDHRTGILRVAQFGQTHQSYWIDEKSADQPVNVEKQGCQSEKALLTTPSAVFMDQTRVEYIESIEKMKAYMAAGDIYVANLTQRLEIWSDMPPIVVFKKMVEQIPAPFSAFFQYPDWEMTQLSSSVERFVSIQEGKLQAKPIKGTIARGKTKASDEQQKLKLSENKKERSELLMVTDLLRNDISRISEPASLSVTKFAAVETFAHVHQLVTTIESKVKKDLSFSEFMRALFPGGSITGTPKKRALEIIKEIEKSPRGVYTGMQGWLNHKMDLDMNIVIRTLVFDGAKYQLGVGGGITYESEAQAEFDEILLKAQAFLDLFQIQTIPSPLFTTGRVEKGTLLNLPAHVLRLSQQYHHADLEQQLKAFAKEIGSGVMRISTDGDNLSKTIRPLPAKALSYCVKLASQNYPASVLTKFKLSGAAFQKIYNEERTLARMQGYDDVLFHTDGFVSEFSIGNFIARRGESYETPASQVLPGSYLAYFSKTHQVTARDIAISELPNYDALYMCNAVRGLVEIQLETEHNFEK